MCRTELVFQVHMSVLVAQRKTELTNDVDRTHAAHTDRSSWRPASRWVRLRSGTSFLNWLV